MVHLFIFRTALVDGHIFLKGNGVLKIKQHTKLHKTGKREKWDSNPGHLTLETALHGLHLHLIVLPWGLAELEKPFHLNR